MNFNTEPSVRFVIEDSITGMKAFIPARRSGSSVLVACAWLAVWGLAEAYSLVRAMDGESSGSPTALLSLTLGGAAPTANFIWLLLGREVIGVEAGDLTHRLEVLGIGWTRTFAGHQVRQLRAVAGGSGQLTRRGSAPEGTIAFEYGGRTYRLGRSLDETQARLLIAQMRLRLPEGAVAA